MSSSSLQDTDISTSCSEVSKISFAMETISDVIQVTNDPSPTNGREYEEYTRNFLRSQGIPAQRLHYQSSNLKMRTTYKNPVSPHFELDLHVPYLDKPCKVFHDLGLEDLLPTPKTRTPLNEDVGLLLGEVGLNPSHLHQKFQDLIRKAKFLQNYLNSLRPRLRIGLLVTDGSQETFNEAFAFIQNEVKRGILKGLFDSFYICHIPFLSTNTLMDIGKRIDEEREEHAQNIRLEKGKNATLIFRSGLQGYDIQRLIRDNNQLQTKLNKTEREFADLRTEIRNLKQTFTEEIRCQNQVIANLRTDILHQNQCIANLRTEIQNRDYVILFSKDN